jgi:hypothetical protein
VIYLIYISITYLQDPKRRQTRAAAVSRFPPDVATRRSSVDRAASARHCADHCPCMTAVGVAGRARRGMCGWGAQKIAHPKDPNANHDPETFKLWSTHGSWIWKHRDGQADATLDRT